MSDVFVLVGETDGVTFIHSVHETTGGAIEVRGKQLKNEAEKYKAKGLKVRIADSTTHLIDDTGAVLIRFSVQRAEMFTHTRRHLTGRAKTSGRFQTREELEEYVCMKYLGSTCSIAEIARQAKVSPGVADRIIGEKLQQYKYKRGSFV